MSIRPTLVLLLAVAAVAGAAPAPRPSAARRALEAVIERYRTLRTYRLEIRASRRVTSIAETSEAERSMRYEVSRPGRFSSLVREAQATSRVVANGESLWTAVADMGQYTVQAITPPRSGADSVMFARQFDPALEYERLLDGVARVAAWGRDTVRTARGPVLCDRYVLTRTAADSAADAERRGYTLHPRVLWVDPKSRMVLRDSVRFDQKDSQLGDITMVVVTRAVVADADPALAADAFVFRPGPGERRVRRFSRPSPEHEALVGHPATDFTLETLAGAKTVRLSQHKGSVVLLDFWATWCGPCRGWLPIVAKAHRDYAAKGLQVYAVNEREPEAKVRDYLAKQKLDLPVLMDRSGSVGVTYRASAIPLTVVVGRDGNVVRVLVGLHDEEDLRDVLREAGID